MILEAMVLECEGPSAEPIEDTVMAALFATYGSPLPPPQEHAKRRRVERRMSLEHVKRSAVRWRLLMRKRVG